MEPPVKGKKYERTRIFFSDGELKSTTIIVTCDSIQHPVKTPEKFLATFDGKLSNFWLMEDEWPICIGHGRVNPTNTQYVIYKPIP